MAGVEVVRSVVFFGVNTFIELYWIHHLGASRGVAGAAMACFLVGGVAGTLLGGRIADRLGLVRALQIGTVAMVPALVALRLCPGAGPALAAAAASGIAVNIPFAVMIKLGQDYLPSRPGTASGVTLGLGVSISSLVAPVFGVVAEARGHRRSVHRHVLRARARLDSRQTAARSRGRYVSSRLCRRRGTPRSLLPEWDEVSDRDR